MPTISNAKREKISEHILHYLFTMAPSPQYTSTISENIARDEEFTKSLLEDLKSKKLVIEIKKNSKGLTYKRRQRWLLSNQVYNIYKSRQNPQHIL